MKDFSKDTLVRKTLLRPLTTSSDSSKSIQRSMPLTLSIRKITPLSKRPVLQEFRGTQTAVEPNLQTRRPGTRIITRQFTDENDESPSLLTSNDIVREYLKVVPKTTQKQKPPLSATKRILNSSRTKTRQAIDDKTITHNMKFLRREFSEKTQIKKPQRMFDYNDIFSIANGRLKLR